MCIQYQDIYLPNSCGEKNTDHGIRPPADYSRTPYDQVELIASVKLSMPDWEFDYWLGQQGKDIN